MLCARCFAPRDMRVVESPDPAPGPKEALVAVRAVSICPSDHHIYKEGHSSGVYPDHPMILGHEFSGVITAVGAEADAPPVGARVAVEPAWHCGHCDLCRRGLINICRNVVFPSYPNRDGALAEYIACPDFSLYPIADHVDFAEAAFAEPLGVSVHATRHAQPGPGDVVAILGAGVIGIALLELQRLKGVRDVYVIEPNVHRHALALRLGATKVYARHTELIEDIGGTADGPSVVYDASSGQDSFGHALEVVEPAGRVVIIGIPPENKGEFAPSTPRRKEVTVTFSRRSRETLRESLDLVAQGKIRASEWPRRAFPLSEAPQAMETSCAMPDDLLRVVVRVGG